MTMMQGRPGFFSPHFPNPWLSFTGAQSATSCYDNAPLHDTLKELVDFSLISERGCRFSGTSMREHWQSGYEDTKRTLKHQKWLRMPAPGAGIIVHDVHREED
jgi:Patatin phospholipase